jgi:hypothetical protein
VNSCDLCYEPTRNRKRDARGQLLCNDCRQSFDYYAQLTPADWLAEYLAMARYVDGAT